MPTSKVSCPQTKPKSGSSAPSLPSKSFEQALSLLVQTASGQPSARQRVGGKRPRRDRRPCGRRYGRCNGRETWAKRISGVSVTSVVPGESEAAFDQRPAALAEQVRATRRLDHAGATAFRRQTEIERLHQIDSGSDQCAIEVEHPRCELEIFFAFVLNPPSVRFGRRKRVAGCALVRDAVRASPSSPVSTATARSVVASKPAGSKPLEGMRGARMDAPAPPYPCRSPNFRPPVMPTSVDKRAGRREQCAYQAVAGNTRKGADRQADAAIDKMAKRLFRSSPRRGNRRSPPCSRCRADRRQVRFRWR